MVGLKGLTSKDRQEWEKQYSSQLEGRSQEEKDNAWRNWNFKKKFGAREDYSSLASMSSAQKEAYWNKQYDDSIASLNKMKDKASQLNFAEQMRKKQEQDTIAKSDALRVDNSKLEMQAKLMDEPEFREKSRAYHDALMRYDEQYNKWYVQGQNAKKDVRAIAEQVSPYYKKYKDTDYLPFSEDDWTLMAAEYNARKDAYGEESANAYIQKKMLDTASENQSTLEKWWNGFQGLGASAYAMIVDATAGIVKGNWDYFSGAHKDVEGANGFTNYLDAIMDNSVTRYADDVLKTGCIFTGELEEYKKLGLSRIPVIQTYDLETGSGSLADMVFNENFLPNALGQYGFTVGSMFMGAGEAKVAGWAFKGIKGATLASNMEKTGQTAMQVRKALGWVQKAENAVNKYAIPGIVGTYEGLQEGLNTKMQFQELGKQMIAQQLSEAVDAKFKELVDLKYQKLYDLAMSKQTYSVKKGENGQTMKGNLDPSQVSQLILQLLYLEAFESYGQQYLDALDQLDYDATRAGTNNFLINSVINGGINSTLKATLFSPSTTGAIRQTRLGKLFTTSGKFAVEGKGALATVKAVLPTYKQAWNIIKEPLGEGFEEYAQDISDAASRGGAENNLAHFIYNKYLGDGSALVGEIWADDFAAAALAAGKEAISKEAFRDAIYGVTSSVMGGPHIASRATAVDKEGNIIRDENGKAKKTFFGRGLNSAGEVESNMERVARLMPWRSGAVLAIQENKALKAELNSTAEQLTAWLRNPDNLAKYDGLVGTFNWAKEMQGAAEGNDEFGYRNSATGKAINDALMLSKLEGTDYYNAFMNQVVEAANLTSDSETALNYIQTMRLNVATKDAVEGLSDEEILQLIKDNANKMLDTQDKISEASKLLDKTFGNLDDDTKEALIFGELQIKDWQDRLEKLQKEIGQLNVLTTTTSSTVSPEARDFLAQYGSAKEAFADRDKLEQKVKELEENIKKTESRKGLLTDQQLASLDGLKKAVKLTRQFLKKYEVLNGLEELDVVFNELDILNMDPVSRAVMLDPKNKDNYSLSQLAVIENLTLLLNADNAEWLNKINDVARVLQATESYMQDYQNVIANPETFSIYSARAKAARETENYKKRYQSLSGITDYNEFSQLMDKLYTDGTNAERSTILRLFEQDQKLADAIGAETNYSKYIAQRQKVAEILKNASKNEQMLNLSKDDVDMFVHATTYLTERGIDMEDVNAVTNALTELNDLGLNLFENYVNAINLDADEATKTHFTSIGETLQTIKDVMTKYQTDTKEEAENNAPVVVTPTVVLDDAPTVAPAPVVQLPKPAPGIFGSAATTIEEANANLAKTSESTLEETPVQPSEPLVVTPTENPTPIIPSGGTQSTTIDVNGQTVANDNIVTPEVNTPALDLQNTSAESSNNNDKSANSSSSRQENVTSLLEAYARNSNEEVAQQALVASNIISNEKEEVKTKALEVLDRLSTNNFNTTEEFVDALNQEANLIDTKGEDELSKSAANALRSAAARITTNIQNLKLLAERLRQLAEAKLRLAQMDLANRSNVFARALGVNPASSNTNSNNVNTTDIQWLKANSSINPEDPNYSPQLAFLDKHKVEQFLASDLIDRNTPVYFMSDPQLTEELRLVYAKGNYAFGLRNLPLIAVVESKNGTIQIGGKTYQPIGVMPATDARRISGSSRLNLVRDRINASATTQELVMDNGVPIETRLSDNVRALPIGQLAKGQNKTALEAGLEDLSILEKAELGKQTKAERKKNPIYKRMKESFLSKIRFDKLKTSKAGKTYAGLTFDIPTLKGGTISADVFVREVHLTKDSNSDATIGELLASNNPSALNANSRIRGYFTELDKALGAFDDSTISFIDGNPTEGTTLAINTLVSTLSNKLSNFIRTRGFNYVITPTERETTDGKAIMELSMSDGLTIIPLGEIHAGQLTDSEKMTILKNLIMDGNNVRMKDNFHSVAQWNVEYNNFETAKLESTPENEGLVRAAKTDISNIYDDDILDVAKPTLSYLVSTVSLEAPYTTEGVKREFTKPTIVNADNASEATPLNESPLADSQVTTTNGSIVDGDTGNTIIGTDNTPHNEAEKIALELAETIQADASNFELSEDESCYIDKTTGRKYARVTSMISADVEGEKFDPNSPWATPSTNIGTGVDEFTRDFFADRFTYNEDTRTWEIDGKPLDTIYPNATAKAYSNFADLLNAFRNRLKADGITILPREVMAHGTLKVTDSEGNIHNIDTAGTLDLLGYDKEGNWHIYDMKTLHSANVDDHKKAKWSRQLSLYKQFLQNTYGIKVKDLTIIPIKVDYPTPKGFGNGRTEYTVRDNKPEGYNGRTDNQLIINKNQEYKGAKPTLLSTIPIDERQLNIQYDKLTDAEKQAELELQESASLMIHDENQSVDLTLPLVTGTDATVTNVEVSNDEATPLIDSTANVTTTGTTDDISDMFGGSNRRRGRKTGNRRRASDPAVQYVPSSLKWGVFEGRGLNVEETLKNLLAAGITEEKWALMSDAEREHELGCKGV